MRKTISIFCLFLALTACGGDTKTPTDTSPADTKDTTPATPSKSNDNTKVGVFIDAPVQGLAYTSAPSGKKGTTNEKGEFEYIDGDTVSFNMGSIELGSATPDKTNKVKVTQLDQALLIAQLLQVLDNDVSEDRIDVSDVVIPETVKKAIVDRLKDKDDEANSEDIITEEQLVSIKKANPKKMTLQRRVKVVSKEDVLKHVKQQIGKSGLRFTASELKNLFLIDVGLLKKFEGDNLAFSASNSIKQINVEKNQAEMSDASWELDAKGNLAISFKRDNCTISKLNEDVDSIDISWLCADKEKPKNIRKGLKYFVKPQPLSANDLSGKSFNFTSLNKENETLNFRNDGTYDSGDEEKFSYKDADHKNAVWIHGGDDDPQKGVLVILAQGTLAKGKFLMIHYNGENKLDSVEVIKVSGNTLRQVFETADNDESSDHSNNTDDNSDSNDNPNSGTQKPNYIPFTQEMISGKTFYALATYFKPNNIPFYLTTTIQFDPLNGKNTARGRSQYIYDENLSEIDTTFSYDFLKDSLILLNVIQSGSESDNVVYKLLTQTDQFLKVCSSFTNITIKDNNNCEIEVWYYDKKDAEAAKENP